MKIEWNEGTVDTSREHMKISYGDIKKDEEPVVSTCVAPADGEGKFVVQFERGKEVADEAAEAVGREL